MSTESLESLLANEEAPAEVAQSESVAKDDFVEVTGDEEAIEAKPEVKPQVKEPEQQEVKEDKPKVSRDIAGIIDERRKRQDAERQLAELRAQSGKPKPDFYDNPEASVDSRLGERVRPLETKIMDLEIRLMKKDHADFDEAVTAYLQAAQNDPVLAYQGDNAPDPLAFIYREGKRIKELSPFDGDIEKLVESRLGNTQSENALLKKQMAALTLELAEMKKHKQDLDDVPRSLNSKASSAAAPKADDEDEPALESMFRTKF